jgi:hypothetical protein
MMFDYELTRSLEDQGLMECTHCNGYGSSLKEEAERCTECDGTGIVAASLESTPPEPEQPAAPARKLLWDTPPSSPASST